ncbi:hypothetical protein B0H13DRAFT_2300351 [Mycena leptocephala]|nr:hypothetical protein B0H13DRAFT_2300351 [Mycena leptocephala]
MSSSALDLEIREQWAQMLSRGGSFTASMAIVCDDAIVHALFSQKNIRPRKRQHQAARLSSRPTDITPPEHAAELCTVLEDHKCGMLCDGQTFAGLQKATSNFMDLRKWVRRTLGDAYGMFPALRWCLQAHVVLLAQWSPVKLALVHLGTAGALQFGIVTRHDIPQGTRLYELEGRLSVDNVDGEAKEKTTALSEMRAHDGTSRVLFGPLRFVNHDCCANAFYQYADDANVHAIAIVTSTFIAADEEITVHYGDDFFEEAEPCRCATCDPRPTEQWIARNKSSRFIDQALKKEAERERNTLRRVRKWQKKKDSNLTGA